MALGIARTEPLPHRFLDSRQLHWLLQDAIGQMRETQRLAADSHKTLDIVVPRQQIGIANRPVDAYPLAHVRFEVEVAPAEAIPAPRQRLATHLVAANPGERLFLYIRTLRILEEKVHHGLIERMTAILDVIVVVEYRVIDGAEVLEAPRWAVLGDIVSAVRDAASALED